MTLTRAEYWSAVNSECAEARNKAGEFDTCRKTLDTTRVEAWKALGGLNELKNIDAARLVLVAENAILEQENGRKWSPWSVALLSAGVAVAGVAAGVVVGLVAF